MSERSLAELSPRERQIVDALYRLGQATVREVIDAIDDPPSYSAVRATLRVLEEKGVVRHEQNGPRYVYLPVVQRDTARRQALRRLVHTFFDGSAEQAAVTLLRMSDGELSDDDVERLVGKIRQARKGGR
ncbi:MAG TPA: BlaI/MecI/CopY family transcriptional regulator [Gemmatimonadota bacterium]|jgi:predicted transcriptional regulator|nr:BlaI/MecI/CopY family transcriptional regulator [Gemmatimonadota bacterium]